MAVEAILPPLIRAMMSNDFYPHPAPKTIELKQTHISYVLLAGDYVYKVKKPVRFPFLDYSTVERRRHFCGEEIRLNRRLAPSVYLGIVAVVQDGARFILRDSVDEAEHAVEYAVKMRRLPDQRLLDWRLREGIAQREDFDRVAEKLAHFYAAASTAQAALYGSAEAISRRLEENLKEIAPLTGETVTAEEFKSIEDYSKRFIAHNGDLLERRVRDGWVREGHGDLRAEHICLEEEPVIFDCIDFSEEFRYGDAVCEIAFLAMDADYLAAPLLSDYFVAQFQKLTEDSDLPALLPLYKCFRACVRGKVETLKSREPEVPEQERAEAKSRARRYFHLAYRYASPPFAPALLIVCGLVASGKSTLARALGDVTGYQIYNSDVVRKHLAGMRPTSHRVQEYRQGLYSEEFSTLTYAALLKQMENCLSAGKGVIVDATFKDPQHRRQVIELASRLRLPVFFVECRVSEEKTLERLRTRQRREGEVSDATMAVYLRQKDEFAPVTEVPESMRTVVNTESDADRVMSQLIGILRPVLAPSG